MLQKLNPGTIVALQTDRYGCFKHAYMYIVPWINGFRICGRSIIVVDATHLKDKYKSVMFIAATTDGN